jgi:hypothetical protein
MAYEGMRVTCLLLSSNDRRVRRKVSPNSIHALAEKYGYAARAGSRQTVRGDFGIAEWLTLLGHVP